MNITINEGNSEAVVEKLNSVERIAMQCAGACNAIGPKVDQHDKAIEELKMMLANCLERLAKVEQ